ncbi:hypothetical protein [Psychrobacter sp. I-STPA6b]|uniref:hypothetical protein n=1 Tax=Psychrobacter sp. I-STPA6b TaxID=2585718 RepID=UPI001D0C0FCB|nr:hypothetical protein [Psychrobacter sp. I-STPA6b]
MLTANNAPQALSTTNFDLPSLHLLRQEIDTALKDAETHLSEFNDDESQAPLLLDSIEVITQLASVLDLISLDGASDLAEVIAVSMQSLYDAGDNTDHELILDISEGIMTLDRYIEFVLLKETLEPSLLVPVINRLNLAVGREQIDEKNFSIYSHSSVSIANPEQNYQPLSKLKLNTQLLSTAYRAGLEVALSKNDGILSEQEQQKLSGMAEACAIPAQQSNCLFWQSAAAATRNLKDILPLSNAQKRTLIYLEQQFHDYLPATDKRFADLVSFACKREHELAEKLKEQYAVNRLSDEQREQMKRFLFGPNREVTNTLNELIQAEINVTKDKVDAFVRADSANPSQDDVLEISQKLDSLGSVMALLSLPNASQALKSAAEAVKQWQTPTPEDFDALLSSLMVAENASIQMAKSHTPGAVRLPLHNPNISLYQLDTSYETLVRESRIAIATVEQAINEYIADDRKDILNLQNTPQMIRQVAGAVLFLGLKDGANMLTRLANYMDSHVVNDSNVVSSESLSYIADVMMAIDHHLEGLEHTHPVGTQAMTIGHRSLNKLMAVA